MNRKYFQALKYLAKILIRRQNHFSENLLDFDMCWRTIEVLFLKQLLILPFLYHKSATMYQTDSYTVSNSKLKPDLCNYAEPKIIEPTAPLQKQHKRGIIFLEHPVAIEVKDHYYE